MDDPYRQPHGPPDPRQQRQARRTALILGAIALALYVGYMVYTWLSNHR